MVNVLSLMDEKQWVIGERKKGKGRAREKESENGEERGDRVQKEMGD